MAQTLIGANPTEKRTVDKSQHTSILNVAEFFCDTLQGEGINIGVPATFLRVQHCTLNCTWCDSTEVWRKGNPYSIKELVGIMDEAELIPKLKNGQHLVLTGGSPIRQQQGLVDLINEIRIQYNFVPYIEVENECVLQPDHTFTQYINCWNNSPKLSNSGMRAKVRYKPDLLSFMSRLSNSWFKFVVRNEDDWKEIKTDFLPFIRRSQVIVMPEGQNQQQLREHYEFASNLAIREGLRFTDRLHITLWNEKTGV